MPQPKPSTTPPPKGWKHHVRPTVLQAVSSAYVSIVRARGVGAGSLWPREWTPKPLRNAEAAFAELGHGRRRISGVSMSFQLVHPARTPPRGANNDGEPRSALRRRAFLADATGFLDLFDVGRGQGDFAGGVAHVDGNVAYFLRGRLRLF